MPHFDDYKEGTLKPIAYLKTHDQNKNYGVYIHYLWITRRTSPRGTCLDATIGQNFLVAAVLWTHMLRSRTPPKL
jgi:hypothetical protein